MKGLAPVAPCEVIDAAVGERTEGVFRGVYDWLVAKTEILGALNYRLACISQIKLISLNTWLPGYRELKNDILSASTSICFANVAHPHEVSIFPTGVEIPNPLNLHSNEQPPDGAGLRRVRCVHPIPCTAPLGRKKLS